MTDQSDQTVTNNTSALPPHDAVGAYVLDALPEEERRAFERHLATCPACQREVADLAPVVALLPRLLELDVDEVGDASAAPEPSPDLRSRILAAARASNPAAQRGPSAGTRARDPEAMDEVAPASATPSVRPRGPVRPGRAADDLMDAVPPVAPVSLLERAASGRREWLVAAALAVAAVGAVIWALTLQSRLNDANSRNTQQAQQLAELRSRADAFGWTLAPTASGPSRATGQLLYSLHGQIAVLYVTGMQPLPPDKAYQVWYIRGSTPVPGDTFKVDNKGEGLLAINTDVATYNALALTAEPVQGSKQPTSAVLMSAQLNGAAGFAPAPDGAAAAQALARP